MPEEVFSYLDEVYLSDRGVLYFYILSFSWTISVAGLFLLHSFIFRQQDGMAAETQEHSSSSRMMSVVQHLNGTLLLIYGLSHFTYLDLLCIGRTCSLFQWTSPAASEGYYWFHVRESIPGNLKLTFADAAVLVSFAVFLFAMEFAAANQAARRHFYFINFAIGKGTLLLAITPLLLTFPNKVGIAFAAWIGLVGLCFCCLPLMSRSLRAFEGRIAGVLWDEPTGYQDLNREAVQTYQRATILIKFLQVLCGLVSVAYAIYIFATVPGLTKALHTRLAKAYGSKPPTPSAVSDETFYFAYVQYQRAIYLLVIGLAFVAFELSSLLRKWLYFMNFGWGKAIAHFVLSLFYLKIVFSKDDIFDFYGSIPAFILLCCLVFCGFSVAHHAVESECVAVLVAIETQPKFATRFMAEVEAQLAVQ